MPNPTCASTSETASSENGLQWLKYNKNSPTARVEQTASSAIPSSSSDFESSGVLQCLRQVLRDMAVRMEEFEKEMKKSRQELPSVKIHSERDDMS